MYPLPILNHAGGQIVLRILELTMLWSISIILNVYGNPLIGTRKMWVRRGISEAGV